MAKTKTQHVCTNCKYTQTAWFAECPKCKEFSTAQEEEIGGNRSHQIKTTSRVNKASFLDLKDIDAITYQRIDTGIDEFNRVLGGGVVPGSYILLSGEPGQGKTTLASEVIIHLSENKQKIAYISGEESESQARMRFQRLGAQFGKYPLPISTEQNIEKIMRFIVEDKPDFVVIDSIQTIYSEAINSAPGSISQVRECGHMLMKAAKGTGTTVLLIGQVLKSGDIAGPKTLEHMVDAVLEFTGDRAEQIRILRASKNRFGTTDEIGLFEMTAAGLKGIEDPATTFVSQRTRPTPGVAICSTMEGTRPVLVEIQALVSPSNLPQPIRTARGLDPKRVQMILGVLQRKTTYRVNSMDVYLNIAGGLKIDESGIDLAICAAIASAVSGRAIKNDMCLFGEITLPGEVREAPQGKRRAKEAERLNYETIKIEGEPLLKDVLKKCLGEQVEDSLAENKEE